MRAELPSSVGDPHRAAGCRSALTLDLSGAAAVLPDEDGACGGPARSRATAPCCCRRRAPTGGSSRSTARRSTRSKPFGWATGFEVGEGGEATLRFRTPLVRYGVVALQAIAWLWVLRVLVRRRFEAPDPDGSAPERRRLAPAARRPRSAEMARRAMRSSRASTALVILGGVVAGGLVLDAADRSDAAPPPDAVVAGVAMPAATPAGHALLDLVLRRRHGHRRRVRRPRRR